MQSRALDRPTLNRLALAAPTFAVSWIVTEAFFKFGSFSLELVGFGALWGALYGLQTLIVGALRKDRD